MVFLKLTVGGQFIINTGVGFAVLLEK